MAEVQKATDGQWVYFESVPGAEVKTFHVRVIDGRLEILASSQIKAELKASNRLTMTVDV